jgi:hypothetical protein
MAVLIEPVGWIVIGIAVLVGFLWETIFGLSLVLIVLGPPAVFWLYLRDIRRSDFLCTSCESQLTYMQVKAHVTKQP